MEISLKDLNLNDHFTVEPPNLSCPKFYLKNVKYSSYKLIKLYCKDPGNGRLSFYDVWIIFVMWKNDSVDCWLRTSDIDGDIGLKINYSRLLTKHVNEDDQLLHWNLLRTFMDMSIKNEANFLNKLVKYEKFNSGEKQYYIHETGLYKVYQIVRLYDRSSIVHLLIAIGLKIVCSFDKFFNAMLYLYTEKLMDYYLRLISLKRGIREIFFDPLLTRLEDEYDKKFSDCTIRLARLLNMTKNLKRVVGDLRKSCLDRRANIHLINKVLNYFNCIHLSLIVPDTCCLVYIGKYIPKVSYQTNCFWCIRGSRHHVQNVLKKLYESRKIENATLNKMIEKKILDIDWKHLNHYSRMLFVDTLTRSDNDVFFNYGVHKRLIVDTVDSVFLDKIPDFIMDEETWKPSTPSSDNGWYIEDRDNEDFDELDPTDSRSFPFRQVNQGGNDVYINTRFFESVTSAFKQFVLYSRMFFSIKYLDMRIDSLIKQSDEWIFDPLYCQQFSRPLKRFFQ